MPLVTDVIMLVEVVLMCLQLYCFGLISVDPCFSVSGLSLIYFKLLMSILSSSLHLDLLTPN